MGDQRLDLSHSYPCLSQNSVRMDSHGLVLLRVLFASTLFNIMCVWFIHVAALSCTLFILIDGFGICILYEYLPLCLEVTPGALESGTVTLGAAVRFLHTPVCEHVGELLGGHLRSRRSEFHGLHTYWAFAVFQSGHSSSDSH